MEKFGIYYILLIMNNINISFLISLLAGLSTIIGYLFLYLKPKNTNKFIAISLTFSATIMVLISLFELIPDGFFYLNNKYGLFLSIIILIFMIIIGNFINTSINNRIVKKYSNSSNLYRVGVLNMIALMLHNLPEGILTFLSSTVDINLGIKMSLAIMLHNIPEGLAISVPIYYGTKSKIKAFTNTLISGLSEPLGALLAYLFLYKYMSNLLISLILLFVAGIMISISLNDILEEANKYSKKSLLIGFILALFIFIITNVFL